MSATQGHEERKPVGEQTRMQSLKMEGWGRGGKREEMEGESVRMKKPGTGHFLPRGPGESLIRLVTNRVT